MSQDFINRRKFLATVGAAAAAARLSTLRGSPGTSPPPAATQYNFVDSHGNVAPVRPEAVAAGAIPPGGMFPATAGAGGGESQDSQTQNPPPQYNILMIMVDQWRNPKWVPADGQGATDLASATPNVTWLQNRSFVFPDFFTAATACTPARATLLTGLYTQQNCMFLGDSSDSTPSLQPTIPTGQQQPLQPGFDTIGTALQNVATWAQTYQPNQTLQNYNTAWVGKWHLSAVETSENCDLSVPYGFGNSNCLPNNNAMQYASYVTRIPSPNGLPNEGTMGGNINSIPDGQLYLSDYEIYEWLLDNWLQGTSTHQPLSDTQPDRTASGRK